MFSPMNRLKCSQVALLAEGVDRNNVTYYYVFNK